MLMGSTRDLRARAAKRIGAEIVPDRFRDSLLTLTGPWWGCKMDTVF
jgi:formate hydrogenlyase subunit 4